MKPNPRPRWLSAAAACAVTALAAAMLSAPVAAHPQSDESGSSPRGSNPAVYIIGDRVVAIRRDRVPPGAYGGHGVDYSPNLSAWILDSGCADHGSVRTR
jgi:hypothetical protein